MSTPKVRNIQKFDTISAKNYKFRHQNSDPRKCETVKISILKKQKNLRFDTTCAKNWKFRHRKCEINKKSIPASAENLEFDKRVLSWLDMRMFRYACTQKLPNIIKRNIRPYQICLLRRLFFMLFLW